MKEKLCPHCWNYPLTRGRCHTCQGSGKISVTIPNTNIRDKMKYDPKVITAIAKAAHEVNRAYCIAIGDDSQAPWETAPDWQKLSAESGVYFHLENSNVTPEQSHQKWLSDKRDAGWKYGPVKDATNKEHPCFVPYEQLSVESKAKDYLFREVVRQMRIIYGV